MTSTSAPVLRPFALATAAVVIAFRHCLNGDTQALSAAISAEILVAALYFGGGLVFGLCGGFGMSHARRAAIAGTGFAALAVAAFGVALALAYRIAFSSGTPGALAFVVMLPVAAYFAAALLVAGVAAGNPLGISPTRASVACAACATLFAVVVIDGDARHASVAAAAIFAVGLVGPAIIAAFKRKNRP